VANHNNIELQKTIKKQSLQLTEITAHYEEIQRQLQTTIDQYGVAQRRIQSLTGELEELRLNYDGTLRSKRQVEVSLEESTTRINELTVINANLSSIRVKIEQELQTLAADYEEVSRELRISDERYQKVQVNYPFDANLAGVKITVHILFFARLSSSAPLKSFTRNKRELSRSSPSRSLWKLKSRWVSVGEI
jgi:chromosome segregation ATPase